MKKTINLYDADAYAVEFEAEVLDCQQQGDRYQVVLDQTLFFPEQGGQSPDQGSIQGIEVVDVQMKDDVIYHTMVAPLTLGAKVSGKIDWKHRFNNMQQHSGEHIFSGTVNKLYGYNNVGFHLSDQIVTMDFDGKLTEEQIDDIELRVNQAIAENVPITIRFPSKEELEKLEYRSKIEIEGQVRIVTVEGYDVCACCAPHVKRTGEIGMLKVMSIQNYKGGVRVSILCGFRALAAFREKAKVISDLMDIFTCGQDNIVENVEKQRALGQTLKGKLNETVSALMECKIAEIPADQKSVLLFESDGDLNVLRRTLNKLVEDHDGVCAIFVGQDGSYNYILGSKNQDCKEIATLLREKLSAKGGGSSQMIQGSVAASRADLEETLSIFQ